MALLRVCAIEVQHRFLVPAIERVTVSGVGQGHAIALDQVGGMLQFASGLDARKRLGFGSATAGPEVKSALQTGDGGAADLGDEFFYELTGLGGGSFAQLVAVT